MANQLHEFKLFVQETHGLVAWALGAGILGALVANFVGISPPWPTAATPLTCAAQLLVLMGVFLFHRKTSRNKAQVQFKVSSFLVALSLIFYLILFSLFVINVPTNGSAVITGFSCTNDALNVFNNCPFLTTDDLAKAGYDIEELWTKLSISVNRTIIFCLWLSLFSSFIYAAGIFVVYTRNQTTSRTS